MASVAKNKPSIAPVTPRLRRVLFVVLTLFAVLMANGLYLVSITGLQQLNRTIYENHFYQLMFLLHLALGLLLVVPAVGFVEIRDTNTPTEFTAEATVVIMKVVLAVVGRDFNHLSFENRFVTGLFGFLVAHNLCRRTHADLGVVLGIAGLDLFTREEIDQIYKLGSSYRRLRQHRQMHLALREIIDEFLTHPDEETLGNLTGVYQLCLRPEA